MSDPLYPRHGEDFESCPVGTQAELVCLREEVTALRLTNRTLLTTNIEAHQALEPFLQRAEKAEAEIEHLKKRDAEWKRLLDAACLCVSCAMQFKELSGEVHRLAEIERTKEHLRALEELMRENARLHEVEREWHSCCEREAANFEEVKVLRSQVATFRAALEEVTSTKAGAHPDSPYAALASAPALPSVDPEADARIEALMARQPSPKGSLGELIPTLTPRAAYDLGFSRGCDRDEARDLAIAEAVWKKIAFGLPDYDCKCRELRRCRGCRTVGFLQGVATDLAAVIAGVKP